MEDSKVLANRIEKLISKGLPGEKAHAKMLPEGRMATFSYSHKESAVLLLLYLKSNSWFIILMKRKEYDGHHSGQISFPGGKKNPLDKSLLQTALRETKEETGVDASGSIIAGALSPVHIPVSGFVVHPFIAVLDYPPVFLPDINEVQYLIEVPLNTLIEPSVFKTKKMQIRNTELNVPYFDIQNEVIWGATAMILNEFLDLFTQTISD